MKSAVVLAFAASASAQVITTAGITANLSMSWQEDPAWAHNDNGLLEPPERALISMSLSFTGQFSQVSFSPPIGGFSSGTILGLASAFFDITGGPDDATGLYNNGITNPASTSTGPNANNAGTSGYGVRGGWRLGGATANGLPVTNGFASIAPGQFPPDPASVNTTNPISSLVRMNWSPNNFSLRDVIFGVHPAAGVNSIALYLDLNGLVGGVAYVPLSSVTFGHVQVMSHIPAPGSATVLLAGVILASRRSRRA